MTVELSVEHADFEALQELLADLLPLQQAGVGLEQLVEPFVDPESLAATLLSRAVLAYGVEQSDQLAEQVEVIMRATALAHEAFVLGYRLAQRRSEAA